MINSGMWSNGRFSWRRIAGLAAYYNPVIRGQLTLYFSISFLFSLLLLFKTGEIAQLCIFTLTWAIVPYMFVFSPLAFARTGDTRIIERMIPASPAEKFVFYMLYLFVAVPVSVYAFPEISLWLYTKIPDIQCPKVMTMIYLHRGSLHDNDLSLLVFVNVLTSAATVLTCLYSVMVAKTNRILKGIISVFAIQISVGLLGAVYGFMSAFRRGLEDGMSGREPEAFDFPQDRMMDIMHDMSGSTSYMIVSLAIIGLYVLTLLYLNYRTLNKRNL